MSIVSSNVCHLSSFMSPDFLIMNSPKVIVSLQQPSGVFAGDAFGEIDTRFLYCAVNALSLLGKLDLLNKEKAVEYIQRCRNYDGGFGSCVGAESHAAQGVVPSKLAVQANFNSTVFVCVAALAILDRLDVVDVDTLGWWLAERQLPSGGLNGRPEKLEDVSHLVSNLFSLVLVFPLPLLHHKSNSAFLLPATNCRDG